MLRSPYLFLLDHFVPLVHKRHTVISNGWEATTKWKGNHIKGQAGRLMLNVFWVSPVFLFPVILKFHNGIRQGGLCLLQLIFRAKTNNSTAQDGKLYFLVDMFNLRLHIGLRRPLQDWISKVKLNKMTKIYETSIFDQFCGFGYLMKVCGMC